MKNKQSFDSNNSLENYPNTKEQLTEAYGQAKGKKRSVAGGHLQPDSILKEKTYFGYYRSEIFRVRHLLSFCIILSLFCTFISYPGIFYSDSYVRVSTGEAVLNSIVKTITGRRFILETGNAFTVIPSFFMGIAYGLTGHVALYTFAQSFAFFLAVLLLIRELDPPGRKLQYVLFALSPLIYGASVYYEANVGCAAGIIALILLVRKAHETKTRKERAAEFLLIAFAAFVTVGYRTNAVTVIPVFVGYLWKLRTAQNIKIVFVLAMVIGMALTWIVPWIFGIQGDSNLVTGFVWEIVTSIQRMEPEAQSICMDYLDDVCGEGATREAVLSSHEGSVDGFMWGEKINPAKMSEPGVTGKIIGKYFQFIAEHPSDWFATKASFVRRAMGIGGMLDLSEYDYNRWDQMDELGFNDSLPRKWFHASYLAEAEWLGFYVRKPWVPFMISLFMVIVEYFRKSEKRGIYALLLWLSVFSYAAYLLIIVVFQLRMFYPALLLMMILDAAITAEWIRAGVGRLGRLMRRRK